MDDRTQDTPRHSPELRILREISTKAKRLARLIRIDAPAPVLDSAKWALCQSVKAWEIELAYEERDGISDDEPGWMRRFKDSFKNQIGRPAGDQTRRATHIRQAPVGESRGGCAVTPISETLA